MRGTVMTVGKGKALTSHNGVETRGGVELPMLARMGCQEGIGALSQNPGAQTLSMKLGSSRNLGVVVQKGVGRTLRLPQRFRRNRYRPSLPVILEEEEVRNVG
eukprot:CAMPEP_0184684942 /NCGR_PEP_ID=MMETSP0312-20130426/17212_1 /TAXON_ID=31354 /ORGANISM="Compsopogon coeruleus, Strain SAG 36.94" /LENGTH=102 /DNA_ID=CAMNT_0027138601 /DNA_START=50 /DNA_END=358 /DNA_ORIENTATION=+